MNLAGIKFGWVFAVITVTLLSGCGQPAPSSSAVDASVDDAFFKSMVVSKSKLSETLKDADSAKFKDVLGYSFITNDGTQLYYFCGKVNAKNGFGAFNGYERFIATPVGAAVESAAGDFDSGWDEHCSGASRDASAF